jgi:tetratricopeptide (TPR) repeat protein
MLAKLLTVLWGFAILALVRCTDNKSGGNYFLSLLDNTGQKEVLLLNEAADSLSKLTPDAGKKVIVNLEKHISSTDERLYSKLLFLKSSLSLSSKKVAYQYIKRAIEIAEQLDENRLVAAYCRGYTFLLLRSKPDYRTAAPYAVKSLELQRRLGFEHFPDVQEFKRIVAQIMYNTKNYSESIRYYRELLNGDVSQLSDNEIASSYNSFAFCYRDQGLYDSAMRLYQKGWLFAKEKGLPIWSWLLRGNEAYIYLSRHQYDSAETIATWYYGESSKTGSWDLAAKAQTMIGRARIGTGDYQGALQALDKADFIITHYPMSRYEEFSSTYQNLASLYERIGDAGKAYQHYKKYIAIRDSVDHSLNETIVENFKTKMAFDKSEASIRLLQQEKRSEQLKRNFIIGLIILFAIISLLVVNRQRLVLAHRAEMAMKEKAAAEAEVSAATTQLQLFKQSIIEKNRLIDSLQEQLEKEKNELDVQNKVELLRQQVILTEDDWQNFKALFEKVYPCFFDQLRQMAPDITAAEQRMAALVRLFADNKQIASVLGISVNSVRKTRQRLSQRLCVDTEEVESLVLRLSKTV